MNYLFFWIRTAARKFASLFKTSPVVIIGAIVIFAAFITARNDISITLDTKRLIFVVFFFVLVSLLLSFRKYPMKPLLVMYSKSRFGNKIIHVLFFIKRAFFNNILLFIFNIVVLKGMVKVENIFVLPVATAISLVLSILLMYLKNEYNSRKVREITVNRAKFSPVFKSAVYDYFTSDFLQTAMVSISLFVIITLQYIKNSSSLFELENPSFLLMGMVVILSFGFMGIMDSISGINWKFISIISPKNYFYHFNRSVFFLTVIFGILIVLSIFIAASFGIVFLFKYLYCVSILLMLSINIAFTFSGKLIKANGFIIAAILTVWISTLHIVFLSVLIVPVLITFLKAKNEYREWYYL